MAVDICISISGVTTQHMTPALPLGHEPLGLELGAERLEAEWHFGGIHGRNSHVSFFMYETG